jgi:hypothetical protein
MPDPVRRRNPERLPDLADRQRAIVVSNRLGSMLQGPSLYWREVVSHGLVS